MSDLNSAKSYLLQALGYVLFLALLCVLIQVLEGWAAILFLQLEFKSEDIAWFVVLNMVAAVLLLIIILVRRQNLMSKIQLRQGLTQNRPDNQQQ